MAETEKHQDEVSHDVPNLQTPRKMKYSKETPLKKGKHQDLSGHRMTFSSLFGGANMDKDSFEGSQFYTMEWTIKNLPEKLQIASEDETLIDSKTFQIDGREGDQMNLQLQIEVSLEKDYSLISRRYVDCWHFKPILMKQSMTCHEDVNIWWRCTFQSDNTKNEAIKFELEKSIVSLASKKLSGPQAKKLTALNESPFHHVLLDMEVVWPKESIYDTARVTKPKPMKGAELMLASGKYSDIKLVCKDKQFSCHKIVLAARSPVFDKMFSNDDNRETMRGIVTIKDMDQDELGAFLKFIYTGNCKVELKQHASALLAAADKYDIEDLVKRTEDSLIKNMNVKNVIDMLVLADKHNASDLREKAMKVIMANFAEVSKQPSWQGLKQSNCAFVSLMEISVKGMKM